MTPSNSIEDILESGAQVEKVLSGFRFTEGPVFSRLGYLLFSDIPANRILKYTPGQPLETFRENSNGGNGLTFDHQGRLLTCEGRAGRVTRTEKDGSITVLADKFEGKALNAPNDIVYCIDGNIYFSDLRGRDAAAVPGKTDFSAVYMIARTGEVRLGTREPKGPNGVALSSNQQILYVADYRGEKLHAYELAGDGSLTPGRVIAETPGGGDGLKTDDQGNIYVATGGGIVVFNSSGKRLGAIAVSESPSNLAWGDDNRTLYITARTSLYKVRLKVTGTRTF